eukprot:TRINITY_DN2538_c0_g1_i1.p1 TRINITY_DN2538_c0_g1~~TRINITY_DN2538_c0_g1_i1.p1  ORF type:complete len:184 (+),score=63.27 TRINITY_DN2538_c0_g1_i1:130-681(+)
MAALTQEQISAKIKGSIREVLDFPKPGISFKDITSLLLNPEAFKLTIDSIIAHYKDKKIDIVAGLESRGFLLATPVALALGAGVALMRKPKKLPGKTVSVTYDLEYGQDKIELVADSIKKGQRVLIIDDLIATGGTAGAAIKLVELLEGEVVSLAFVCELKGLNGRNKLGDKDVFVLVEYDDE